MKLLNTAIIRLTLVLMVGILTGFYISPPLYVLLICTATVFLFFMISFFRAERILLQDSIFGIHCFLLFFFIGFLTVHLHDPKNQPLHFSRRISSTAPLIRAVIAEELKPDLYRNKYLAEVKNIEGKKAHGKLLVLLPRKGLRLKPDDAIMLASGLEPIPPPLNPQQFDYRKFMRNRGVLLQSYASSQEVLLLKSRQGYKKIFHLAQEKIKNRLEQYKFGKDELAVIQALLLGERKGLSVETYDNFIEAGVVHILAVSGLHVGMILLILNQILSPLSRLRKGKYFKIVLLLVLLWSYAFLSGLSPSIVRAVSMFSFLAVGMQLRRQSSVINTLFLSLMLLLLIRPQWLFEVGFQLSYLAVFSIVIIQPRLYSLLAPQTLVTRYFWGLFTVTLAAQAGVMPLSLFYFHQFPGLFFLSNLVLLPFVGLLLGTGILVISLALLDLLPDLMANAFGTSIATMNDFVAWIAQQEFFLFKEIPFTLPQLLAFYTLLAALLFLRKPFTFRSLSFLLCSFIFLQGAYLEKAVRENHSEFVVFHRPRNTVIGVKRNNQLLLRHNLRDSVRHQTFLSNYMLDRGLTIVEEDMLPNIFQWEDGFVFLIDSTSVSEFPDLHPNKIILTGSPEINLERLLKKTRPTEIIVDGSNYRNYVDLWRATCKKNRIPFHYTGEKGSYFYKTK